MQLMYIGTLQLTTESIAPFIEPRNLEHVSSPPRHPQPAFGGSFAGHAADFAQVAGAVRGR